MGRPLVPMTVSWPADTKLFVRGTTATGKPTKTQAAVPDETLALCRIADVCRGCVSGPSRDGALAAVRHRRGFVTDGLAAPERLDADQFHRVVEARGADAHRDGATADAHDAAQLSLTACERS
jgi:hypothetical protein